MKRSDVEIVHPFQRLQTTLANLIAETTPGSRLPAEPELAQQLGVSRATLREAMRTFEGQGLIRRRQGVGTFVVSNSQIIESGLEVLESIETLSNKIGLDVSMGTYHTHQIEANAEQAEALGVEVGTPLLKVVRVINAEDRPVAFLVDILPTDILSLEELKRDFTGSVLDLLMRRGEPELSNSLTDICSVPATSEIARALEIQRGDVLLLFTARLFSNLGRVVDYSYSYFLPGYFRFHVVRRLGSPLSQP
jgi:GntR family transcriptional regulator